MPRESAQVFDWAYWFMTALCFRPCDYGHLWDSSTGYMYGCLQCLSSESSSLALTGPARRYALGNYDLQQQYAGAASANDCPWFTDNPLQVGVRVGVQVLCMIEWRVGCRVECRVGCRVGYR